MKKFIKRTLVAMAMCLSLSPVMAKASDKTTEITDTACQHVVNCSDETLTCLECGKKLKSTAQYYVNHNSKSEHNAKYHWQKCQDCGEYTMPKLVHYISCLDYPTNKDACSFCGSKDVTIPKKNKNIHASINVLRENSKGELIHVKYCTDCNKDVKGTAHKANCTYKKTKYNSHTVVCSCGYRFSDEEHTYGKLVVTKKATTKHDGVMIRKCTHCNAKKTYKISRIASISFDYPVFAMDTNENSAVKANEFGDPNGDKLGVIVMNKKGDMVSKKYYSVKYEKSKKTGKNICIVTLKGRYKGVKKMVCPTIIVPKPVY